MTHEELDKATADEAWRIMEEGQDVAVIAARLARERAQERANPLVVFAVRVSAGVFIDLDEAKRQAAEALAAYTDGKAAR
jgi:hypothetical protein